MHLGHAAPTSEFCLHETLSFDGFDSGVAASTGTANAERTVPNETRDETSSTSPSLRPVSCYEHAIALLLCKPGRYIG